MYRVWHRHPHLVAASPGLGRGVSGYVCHTTPVAIHAWLRRLLPPHR